MKDPKELANDVDISAFPASNEINWTTALEYIFNTWINTLSTAKGIEIATNIAKFKKADKDRLCQLLCTRIWLERMSKRGAIQ
jgi:hypothetical protein